MVVGDSVAHQFDGDVTWRYRLGVEFKRQNAAVNFVGPFRWGYGESHNYLAKNWDSDHDSQGATLITDFMDISPVPGAPNWGRFNIVDEMQSLQPDVVVSVMGNNDVNNAMVLRTLANPISIRDQYRAQGRSVLVEQRVDALVDGVLEDYTAFLASARSRKADVRVVVSEITSQLIEPWVRDEVNDAFAARLPSTSTSPLVVALSDDPKWAKAGYTVDGIHTTPTGDLLMAQKMATGIHAVAPAVLPGAAKVPQVTVPWSPVLTPKVSVSRRKVVVNWAATARANTVLGVQVKFTDLQNRKSYYSTLAQKPSWTSAVKRPGRYRVQIQGIRGTMRSTWSKVYEVRVR